MDIRIIIRLHNFIQLEQTGTPKDLGFKLGISTRTLYEYIAFMKQELNAPIVYERQKQSYKYSILCGLCFEGKY
jgi:predicted DNA-binding transcriptional regulator YafY